MKRVFIILLTLAFIPVFTDLSVANEEESISRVLDKLHQAASDHDADTYFSLYTQDAVFLGTDATERWNMETMKKWAIPYFKSGKGWTYVKLKRFINVSANQKTAWFDETLMNEKYLDCRGSGVLVKDETGWKIAQYNLTFPIPNEIALNAGRY